MTTFVVRSAAFRDLLVQAGAQIQADGRVALPGLSGRRAHHAFYAARGVAHIYESRFGADGAEFARVEDYLGLSRGRCLGVDDDALDTVADVLAEYGMDQTPGLRARLSAEAVGRLILDVATEVRALADAGASPESAELPVGRLLRAYAQLDVAAQCLERVGAIDAAQRARRAQGAALESVDGGRWAWLRSTWARLPARARKHLRRRLSRVRGPFGDLVREVEWPRL